MHAWWSPHVAVPIVLSQWSSGRGPATAGMHANCGVQLLGPHVVPAAQVHDDGQHVWPVSQRDGSALHCAPGGAALDDVEHATDAVAPAKTPAQRSARATRAEAVIKSVPIRIVRLSITRLVLTSAFLKDEQNARPTRAGRAHKKTRDARPVAARPVYRRRLGVSSSSVDTSHRLRGPSPAATDAQLNWLNESRKYFIGSSSPYGSYPFAPLPSASPLTIAFVQFLTMMYEAVLRSRSTSTYSLRFAM